MARKARTLAVVLVLAAAAGVLAAPPRPVSGSTVVERGDGGQQCTAIVDVDVDGCWMSRAIYVKGAGQSWSNRYGCGAVIDACGDMLRCDCTLALADAGFLLPDGGDCRSVTAWSRGIDSPDPCGPGAILRGLRGGGGTDFPITPWQPEKRRP